MALIAGDSAPAASFGGRSVAGECGRCCISTAYSLDHSTELDRCRVSATKGRKALLVPLRPEIHRKGSTTSRFGMDARLSARVLICSDTYGLEPDVVETSGPNLATFSWLMKLFLGGDHDVIFRGAKPYHSVLFPLSQNKYNYMI